jgi:hypothetical protein
MHGEVRVTVIATGFDRQVTGTEPLANRGTASVLTFPQKRPSTPHATPHVTPSATPIQPRPQTRPAAPPVAPAGSPGNFEMPDMEIPTFIRRQMD